MFPLGLEGSVERIKMTFEKGDLVEFTDDYYFYYPPSDESKIKFGVVVEDTNDDRPRVMIADYSIVTANYVWSYKWAGWIPEELEEVWEKFNPCDYDNLDD
jgi:hypothetical protein